MTEPGDPRGTRWGARRFSLRGRVTLLAAACVAGAVALVSIGAYMVVRSNLYQQLDDSLLARAQAAANSPQVQTELRQVPGAFLASADLQIGQLNAAPDVQHAVMTYPLSSSPPPFGQDELAVANGDSPESLRTDFRSDSRVVALPTGHGEAIVLAQSMGPTKRTLNELALVLFLIGGAGILVAAAAGTAVARTGLRPVDRLTSAAERVARTGDLRPIPVSGDDELARLTQTFNTMLGTVADSQERQRQLVADAGHELRTPLTSLRTNLELLLAASKPGAPPLRDEDRVDIIADISGQLDELTQLIGDLVELARQDEPRERFERVELLEVVERALDRARRRAGEINFDVSLQPWVLTGDNSSLERAVLNLLDNAVKFSPPDATVWVRLYPLGDGTAVVEVADAGPGIAEEDLPKVFDRFYRSSEARTLPGSGLGLAIVKHAAERHGGAVYASQAPEGGALMTIRLPGAPG
ncbi:two-component system histidine kinase [Amycolatopsis mediterranei S699]|uniref:histidine kinase n=2 Tax=Amycolatopsis mediterranei TaxID=33910 RepID=A0A0H3DK06_AMYMU|nr:HAMP domain-containing sensor histidine kinase [Amycolatopsis mediterranei]ADJ50029.1 two-component system histidine kinase [Amycolatopsis mediterranei U32]AEK47025.1 two-component system histidine kinase [Amycolatopsis mediterranei S699]AFO81737.1 two-component system histidine kinase [Amycolatopsis mediterranei S699]AGT88866.1 two-component system histidine kinase [Amycolatopsis mediterranei RB]KDO07723.1 histidine kinase [Amycolatopsis mediterranei]